MKSPDDNSLDFSRPTFRRSLTDAGQNQDAPTQLDSKHWENALGANAEFVGTLEVGDNIRLEGKFKGKLITAGTVHIADGAQVNADVQAGFAVIGGTYRGELRCAGRVDLLASCRAQGKLSTERLTAEAGALFDGDVEMTRKPAPAQDAAKPQTKR